MPQPRKLLPAFCALVVDGQDCHALTGVRSLGRHNVRVTVASDKTDAMSFYSRYCAERLLSPSAADDPAGFGRWLLQTLQARRYDVLLFFGEASAAVIMQHREQVQALTGCPLPTHDAFLTADRKDRVLRLARAAGVRAPRTLELTCLEDADAAAASLRYPVVVKGVWGSCGRQVAVARDASALRPTVERIAALQSPDLPLPILQEYIPGTGYGVSALCRAGEPRAVFQHRRLEEHDIRRGLELAHAASGAESVHEPEMRQAAEALLRALQWDGMAMVEFRRSDLDGHFYVMEINPRFVGSLDLAVASGVDFPWLYAQQALGRPVAAAPAQRTGVRYHWLVSKSAARAFEDPAGTMRAALATLRPGVRSDLCWRDPGPHYAHLRAAAWWMREYRHPSPPAAPAWRPAAEATPAAGPPAAADAVTHR